MGILKDTDRRYADIQKKVGLFILAAVAAILVIIIFIGMRQDIFTRKTSVYLMADSGYDINEGQAVKLSGFKIGRVKSISLEENAKVRVELSINNQYMKWVKIDSRARLMREGLIGDSIIEITPGSENAKEAVGEVMLPFRREKGISEIAGELKDEITPALKDLKQIIAYINDPDGDIKQTMRNINTLSKDVNITRQKLDALLVNTDKNLSTSFRNVDSVLDTTKQTISGTGAIIKRIDKDLPDLLDKTGKSLENVQKTTEVLRKAAEQAAPQVPSLVEKSNDVADDAKEVMGSIKKVWPLRLFIKQPEEKKLNVDSYE